MHPLQQHILDLLLERSPRRYAELKPDDVEGNSFAHHLKKLMREEFVMQLAPGSYGLGKAGRKLAGNVSATTGEIRSQQKILVEVALQNTDGDWLLFERSREPYRGLIGFPAGRRHAGESLHEAAVRDIYEKTGISVELRFTGTLSFSVFQGTELYNFVETHIYAGTTNENVTKESVLGQPCWKRLDESNLKQKPFFPGLAEVYHHVTKEKAPFFCEYHIQLESGAPEYKSERIAL